MDTSRKTNLLEGAMRWCGLFAAIKEPQNNSRMPRNGVQRRRALMLEVRAGR